MRNIFHDRTFSDILLEEGLITQDALAKILGQRDNTAEPIGDLLARLGAITEKDRVRCVGKQIGVPFADLTRRELDSNVARLITHSVALRLHALPIERSASAISVAMVNPLDITAIDELHGHTNLEIDPVIATEEDIREGIFRAFGAYDDLGELVGEAVRGIDINEVKLAEEDTVETELNLSQLKEISEGAPVIRLVNAIITRAIASRASDIHIEPERHRVRIRYRVDGLLQEAMIMPKDLQHPFVSRLKIIASMDIAERRAPQDGRLTLKTSSGEYDFRISTYPSLHGENVVIRILDRNAGRVALSQLGMREEMYQSLQRLIFRPHGMILACGPTGAGKTTTLYACINALNSIERNIMTIEDPVEYQVAGIVQGNVNNKVNMTFSTGLRTLVRQDPDVILVGEIRDAETARIAIEASLTGHLVLSTIHANDSAGAVTRLLDMGVEPFLVASALVAALSQRLVRTICSRCIQPYEPAVPLLETIGASHLLDEPGFEFQHGIGCDACGRTGYKGRAGIYELMEVNPAVQRLILDSASSQDIKAAALPAGAALRDDAIRKIHAGVTTAEEVVRVTI